jgi:hypothetical protein
MDCMYGLLGNIIIIINIITEVTQKNGDHFEHRILFKLEFITQLKLNQKFFFYLSLSQLNFYIS